jgi:ABC-type lipoprotein release transport system permease subunit
MRFVLDIGRTDPAVFVAVFFILLLVGTASFTVPLLRVARIDPIRILRRE